jgi:hypothetical protein
VSLSPGTEWESAIGRLREVDAAAAVGAFCDAWEAAFDALESMHRAGDDLTGMLLLRVLREDLDAIVVPDMVRAARESGASWADVGTALGVSRQAARARFREAVEG